MGASPKNEKAAPKGGEIERQKSSKMRKSPVSGLFRDNNIATKWSSCNGESGDFRYLLQ